MLSARRTMQTGAAFFESEASSGIVLIAAAGIAMVWANTAPYSYEALRRSPLTVGIEPLALSKSFLLWVNDGLMAIFFLLVGLEIKREMLRGELTSIGKALLPVVAAAGGMIVPAAIYASLNVDGAGSPGWGIPMATDIAFALGALALLGKRVAASLRIFLTAVAIADDLGAVAVIALFYTSDLSGRALATAAFLVLVLIVVNQLGVQSPWPFVMLGVALWVAILKSGVHATVAGVILAFFIPASASSLPDGRGRTMPLLDRLEHALQPWVAFLIMPVFALVNAGVQLPREFGNWLFNPIALGIILGLFIGKQVGVAASCWVLVRLGLASLPASATWRQLYGVSLLCGIGFTMSLFIATLAFADPASLGPAKVGILAGSLVSGVVGYVVLARAKRPGAT